MESGEVYDSFYVYDFAREFLTSQGLRDISVSTKTPSDAAHLTNLIVTFTRKAK
jgi:hypothetical protein